MNWTECLYIQYIWQKQKQCNTHKCNNIEIRVWSIHLENVKTRNRWFNDPLSFRKSCNISRLKCTLTIVYRMVMTITVARIVQKLISGKGSYNFSKSGWNDASTLLLWTIILGTYKWKKIIVTRFHKSEIFDTKHINMCLHGSRWFSIYW